MAKIGPKEKAMRDLREGQGEPAAADDFDAYVERIDGALERGRTAFTDLGRELGELRESKAWRGHHPSFEDCCNVRWGISRQHAHRLIQGSQIVGFLAAETSPTGDATTTKPVLPGTERQARELAKLPESERIAAWQEAVDAAGGKPTAKLVREIVAKRLAAKQPKPKEDEPPEDVGDDDEPDPVAEWQRAERELADAKALIAELQAKDLAKRHAQLADKYSRLEGRLREETSRYTEAARQARSQGEVLKAVRGLLGVSRSSHIVEALRELLK